MCNLIYYFVRSTTSGRKQPRPAQAREERFGEIRQRDRETEALRERLSRPSEASLRINESLEFDQALRSVIYGARSQRIILECAATQGVV